MYDFYAQMKSDIVFNKFEVNSLLFVEYNCPLKQERVEIWSQHDYVIYVLSGEKTWLTKDESWTAKKGEALYIKKGATIIEQKFDEDFCMLAVFITDDLIRGALKNIIHKTAIKYITDIDSFIIDKIDINNQLITFFQSLLGYFHNINKPMESLLELKAQELILNLIHNNQNLKIASYLKNTALHKLPSLTSIMESNYCYNLSLEQYAKLCNRSKSSFKRDFTNHYNCSPGKWILEKRLAHASHLLKLDFENISQIAYDCGFESIAHFSRTFKNKYGVAPSIYKNLH